VVSVDGVIVRVETGRGEHCDRHDLALRCDVLGSDVR
jgi:hypothetical protein